MEDYDHEAFVEFMLAQELRAQDVRDARKSSFEMTDEEVRVEFLEGAGVA